MTRNLQKFGSTIVALIVVAVLIGALLNLGGPPSSLASSGRNNNTTDLPKDLFAESPFKGVISKPLLGGTATSAKNTVNDNALPLPRDSRKGLVRLAGEVPSALARA